MPGPRPEDAGEDEADAPSSDEAQDPEPRRPAYRLSWARLLARVFLIDVTVCPHCGGKMKIIAALTEPGAIRAYLDGVGPGFTPASRRPGEPPASDGIEYEHTP